MRTPTRLLAAALATALLTPCTARAAGLGATFDAGRANVTFAVYSAGATRVEVWVYDKAAGEDEKAAYELTPDPAMKIWTRTVPVADLRAKGVTDTVFYGYRVWGPNWPYAPAWRTGSEVGFVSDADDTGHRFNPNKLLLDPYAREVSHDDRTPAKRDDTVYLSGPGNRARDSGSVAPKGVVLSPAARDYGTKPTRAFKDDIVYEVHLQGLTAGVVDGSVPPAERGTYAGAVRRAADLKALGVTAVEFLPVFEFQNDTNGLTPGSAAGDNYWGYDPNSFFAPDRRYAADKSPGGPTREFRAMVKAFHAHGIKVYLDVVYNHTGEGGCDRGTGAVARVRSWRGLDNPAYYEVRDDNGGAAAARPRGRRGGSTSITTGSGRI